MRKIFYFILFMLFIHSYAFSQVPNGGFESWTLGYPDNWLTNNIPGVVDLVTQSNSSHSGSSAVKGQVGSYMGTTFPPLLFSTNIDGAGFPVSIRYNSMKGYFKFNPAEGDRLLVTVSFTLNSESIGGGAVDINTALDSYTEINIPINYINESTPDTAYILVTIVGPNSEDYHVGSEFYADDLSLSEAIVAVEENVSTLYEFELTQNYPNPFNPSTTISYQLPENELVSLKVYDILGNEVAQLINETIESGKHTVNFNASSLPSGVYVYCLKAGDYVSTKKMTLLK